MAASAFLDLMFAYDAATGLCDLVFDGQGFSFDRTAQTPLLISLGTERRADPDDVPPGTVSGSAGYSGIQPNARRGSVLDALDANGARIGSRLWLLEDAKQTEDTRQNAIGYATEATQWIDDLGVATAVDASWVRSGLLGLLVQAGSFQLSLPLSLA